MAKVNGLEHLSDVECHFKWDPADGDIDADPQKGIPHMEANINSYPSKSTALLLIGYLHTKFRTPNYDEALRAFDTVLGTPLSSLESPDERRGYEIIARGNKAHVLKRMGETQAARKVIADMKDDLKTLPPKTRACLLANHAFALALFGPQKFELCVQLYTDALSLDCESYAILEGFAFSYGRNRRYEQGGRSKPTKGEQLVMLEAIRASQWKNPHSIVLLADLLFVQGRPSPFFNFKGDSRFMKLAEELYKRAYDIDPHAPHVLMRCGKAFHIMGNKELGLKCLHEAVELDPYSAASKFRLGQCYSFYKSDQEKLQLAKKYLMEAVTIGRRRHFFAEIEYGKVCKRLDRHFDMKRHLEEMKVRYEESDENMDILEKEIEKIAKYEKEKREKRKQSQGPAPVRHHNGHTRRTFRFSKDGEKNVCK